MDSACSKSTNPETAPEAARGKHRWWRLGIADLLLLVLVLGIMQRSQGSMLDDPGLGWHVRHIDAMWAEGGWLTTDPFSGPRGGQPWRTNQWLGDLGIYLAWNWGGLEGIAALTTIVLALTFRWLFQMLRADGVPWPLALVWTMLGALGTSLSWVARPNVVTLLMVMVTAWTLDRFHRGRCSRRQTLWLIPMFAVWTNIHGGFVAGLILLGISLLVEGCLSLILSDQARRKAARGRLVHVGLLLAGALLATLINPYGWGIYPWIFQLLGDPFFMNLHTEWLSPNFHDADAYRFELLMLALPLLLAFSRRRAISLMALTTSVVWLHFAFSGQRYVALWVLISVPLMARLSTDILYRIGRRQQWSLDVWRTAPPRGGLVGVGVILLGLLAWARWTDGYAQHQPKHIPVDALTYVLDHHAGGTVFHDYGWGGWLTWHGWPGTRNWIDDRNEVQGRAHIEQYLRIMQTAPGWREALAKQGAQAACIPVDSALAECLAVSRDWSERYRDNYAVVFEHVPRQAVGSAQPERTELGMHP